MARVGPLLDWCVDELLDLLLVTALVGGWLAGVVALFALAPWWAGVLGVAAGLPFVRGLRASY